jgi:Flavin containing amine oxidoreductase
LQLGVEPFPSWDAGTTVRWQHGERSTYEGMFPPSHGDAEAAVRSGARTLTEMAATLPADSPWSAADAAEWDTLTFRGWLSEHVEDAFSAGALANAFWSPRVWTTYGHALRAPVGPLHSAGTETSTAWNAKMEGALRSGEAVADDVLEGSV